MAARLSAVLLLLVVSINLVQSVQLSVMAELEAFPPLNHPKGVDMSKFTYDPEKAAEENKAKASHSLLDIHGSKEDYDQLVEKETEEDEEEEEI